MNKLTKLFAVAALVAVAANSYGGTITLGSPATREASLFDAVSGYALGVGNPKADDIEAKYATPVGAWTDVGFASQIDGLSNGYLTITNVGGWGQPPVSGTWTIDPSFYLVYGQAVISMHVGGGGKVPDGFIWLITSGVTSGTWSYNSNAFNGGGLSNLHLWGSGDPVPPPPPGDTVPDSGSTIALLGLTLAAFGFIARRK